MSFRDQLGKGEAGDQVIDVSYYSPRFSDIGAIKGSQLSKREMVFMERGS